MLFILSAWIILRNFVLINTEAKCIYKSHYSNELPAILVLTSWKVSKHCRKPHYRNVVVDTFRQKHLKCWLACASPADLRPLKKGRWVSWLFKWLQRISNNSKLLWLELCLVIWSCEATKRSMFAKLIAIPFYFKVSILIKETQDFISKVFQKLLNPFDMTRPSMKMRCKKQQNLTEFIGKFSRKVSFSVRFNVQ